MKSRNLLQLVFILLAGQLLFACNSAKYYEFASSKQAPYKVAKEKAAPEQVTEESATLTTIALEAATEENNALQAEPQLEASIAPVAPATVAAPKAIAEVEATETVLTEAEALALAKERIENMSKAEKREFKKEVKEALKQSSSTVSIVEIILAVLLPPLAVFLHDGLGTTFWISLLLTLLFWIPGVIYALLIVTDTI